jgi:hypothetical protein
LKPVPVRSEVEKVTNLFRIVAIATVAILM